MSDDRIAKEEVHSGLCWMVAAALLCVLVSLPSLAGAAERAEGSSGEHNESTQRR